MVLRKPLSKKRRFDILQRDGFVCQYCGQGAPVVTLHVDHIIPVAHGGENDDDNLVTACESCNNGKSARFHDPILAEVVDLRSKVKELRDTVLALRARNERAWSNATADAEQIIHTYGFDVSSESLKQLIDMVWRVGTSAAHDAFVVGEYEVGDDPEILWFFAMEYMRREADSWGEE